METPELGTWIMFTIWLGRKLSLSLLLSLAIICCVLSSEACAAASSGASQTASFVSQALSTLSSALAWGIGVSFTAAAIFAAASLVWYVIQRSS